MTSILEFDQQIFQLINYQWSNNFFDAILPFWRNKYVWLPLYAFLVAFLLINFRIKGLYLILSATLLIGLTDSVSSRLIKKSIKRIRPCNEEPLDKEIRILVNCGKGYSFTSSHAANHFALATFLGLTLASLFPWLHKVLLIWAGLVGYAQIYVGAHYPLDVVAGAIFGILCAYLFTKLYDKVIPQALQLK